MTAILPGSGDDLLAAEFAFALLDPADAAAAEARAGTDPDFAAAVAYWQDYAAGMAVGRDEAPRPSSWSAIATSLPANDVAPIPGARVWPWQVATALAASLVLVLSTMLISRPPPAPVRVATAPTPAVAPMVAMLQGNGQPAIVAISMNPADRSLTVMPVKLHIDGRAAELWVVPASGAPRSLGTIAQNGPIWRVAAGDVSGFLGQGATLAISVEPLGGSPTGLPTGPVILSGKLSPA